MKGWGLGVSGQTGHFSDGYEPLKLASSGLLDLLAEQEQTGFNLDSMQWKFKIWKQYFSMMLRGTKELRKEKLGGHGGLPFQQDLQPLVAEGILEINLIKWNIRIHFRNDALWVIKCREYHLWSQVPSAGHIWHKYDKYVLELICSLVRIFEPICANARWALMSRFLSVRLWLDENYWTIIYVRLARLKWGSQRKAGGLTSTSSCFITMLSSLILKFL